MMADLNCGQVKMQGRTLAFGSERLCWSVPVDEIKAIVEYTTEEGPFLDDHFLAFVDSRQGVYHLSLEAEGCSDVLRDLGRLMDCQIELTLFWCTEFRSRIVFPREFANCEGFFLKRISTSWLKALFSFGQPAEMVFTPQLLRAVNQ